MSAEEVVHTCAGIDCGKPAKMQCPTCLKLNAVPTYFCDQECFKKNWAKHVLVHKDYQNEANFVPPKFKYTGPLRPHYVTPQVTVPSTIQQPEYAKTGQPILEDRSRASHTAPICTPEEIEGIRKACLLGRKALDLAGHMIKPGVIADHIDKAVHNFIVANNAYPSPLNYRGFPKSCCISVNEVICHGIPDMRPLEDGDIVNVDISVFLNGYHADLNETYCVGNVDADSKRLIKAAHDSLQEAIKLVRPGTLFRDFGDAITRVCRKEGFQVGRAYCGHGVGKFFHCAPNIPHYANNKAVGSCKPGMVFTIEPMVNAGAWQDRLWPDDWTSVTEDGKRSAQFEHTLLVTEDGCEVLTARLKDSPKFWWEIEGEAAAATKEASKETTKA